MIALTDLPLLIAVGAGATAVMDAWLLALQRLGVPTASFAMVGRWIGHMAQGRFTHPAIARATPVRHELALGWAVHYAVGIAYAGLLVAVQGAAWLHTPTVLPAIAVGLATVAVPMVVMQPAFGAGLASRRTATPWKNNLRTLANHTVFGLGLYLAAVALRLAASTPSLTSRTFP